MIDITGQQFGRLTVLRRVNKRTTAGNAIWVCKCGCGNIKEADSYQLRHGGVQSCGCLRQERSRQEFKKNSAMIKQMGKIEMMRDSVGNPLQAVNMNKRNKSGVVGVSFDEATQRWVARMMVQGSYVLNSAFKEFEDAVEARKQAENKYLKHKP